jgi:hypothetical protein
MWAYNKTNFNKSQRLIGGKRRNVRKSNLFIVCQFILMRTLEKAVTRVFVTAFQSFEKINGYSSINLPV